VSTIVDTRIVIASRVEVAKGAPDRLSYVIRSLFFWIHKNSEDEAPGELDAGRDPP
jgi:hypothetical protein